MSPPSDPLQQPPPRSVRWLWLVAFGLLLVGIPVGYIIFESYAAQRDLDSVLAELDATDPGWRLEEIEANRKVAPDAQNSALLVNKLVNKVGSLTAAMSGTGTLLDHIPPQARLNQEQLRVLREAFEPLATVRAEALRLKDLPDGRFPVQWTADFFTTSVPHVYSARETMFFLEWDATLRTEERDMAGAVTACAALVNCGRSLGDEPRIIPQLVRLAGQKIAMGALERVLAQGEAPEKSLREMQELVEREMQEPFLIYALRGERAGADRFYRALGGKILTPGALTGAKGIPMGWGQTFLSLVPVSKSRSEAAHLRVMTQIIEASKLPVENQARAIASIETTIPQQPLLVRMLAPALTKIHTAFRRNQATLRSAEVAVAAERYRLRHKKWPDIAEDFVRADLLGAVPLDPFDGQPLRWRLLPDGAVAYSVGFDGVDNGGVIERDNPRTPNTDLGFRLWHVAARRQPPQAGAAP